MVYTKAIIITLLVLCAFILPAQTNNRNQQVRSLNSIVDFMDEASRINMQMYYDIISFTEGYNSNVKKTNDNAWHVAVSGNTRMKSTGLDTYKEIHPDAEGFINDYESRLLSYFRSKQNLNNRQAKFPVKNADVLSALNGFRLAFDSMLYRYKQMVDYVNEKKFKTDNQYNIAQQIIADLQPWFDKYDAASKTLYDKIQHYYIKSLPPLKSQTLIRTAQQELLRSVDLVGKWADQLHAGNNSERKYNDSLLRVYHKEGSPKAAVYLQKTYGFNDVSNGAFPRSRYDMFYTNMSSTIFWYKNDTATYSDLMSKEQNNYNKFVNNCNWVIHYYNQFIECADGVAFARNMDNSLKMAGEIGADTSQNVLLKRPRLSYQFALVKQDDDNYTVNLSDTSELRRRDLIRSADPHHTVYLLDVSNSMKEEHKLDTLKEAMKYLVTLQRPVDNISIVAFADSAETIMRFTPCNEKKIIYKNIDKLQTSGATNAEDAMRDGYKLIDSTQQYKGRTKIVIITDGQFTLEKPTKKKIEAYQKAGVHLSILLLGKIHDIDTIEYFKMLCEKGNGMFYDMRRNNLKEVLVNEATN